MKRRPLGNKETEVKLIENLDELQAIVDQPVYCEFKLNGTHVRLACKRVSQELNEKVRALQRSALPPWNPKLGKDGEYDYMNPNYLALKELNAAKARSLIVYAGCPAVSAKKTGLIHADEIHAFVRGILTETIMEAISLTIVGGGMELVERSNFISTAASES